MQDERCGIFGKWIVDDHGLPAVEYDCNEFKDERAWHFTTYGKSNTHYHLLGNGCWLGIATNHGQVVVLDPRRGFTLIGTAPGKSALDMDGLITFVLKDQAGNTCIDINSQETQPLARRVFGAGYIEKEIATSKISAKSRIMFPSSSEPIIIAECEINNPTDEDQVVDVGAAWNIYQLPLSKSLIVSWNRRKHYQMGSAFNGLLRFAIGLQKIFRTDTDGARCKHASKISYQVTKTLPAGIILTPAHVEGKKRDPAAPSGINYHFKPLIIVYLDDDSMNTRFVKQGKKRIGSGENFFDGSAARIPEGGINNHNARIDMITKVTVPAGASKKVRFLLCGADIESMNFLVAKYTEIMASDALLPSMGHWFADNAISFDMPDLHWLEREVTWHCIYLLSSLFKDEYFNLHRAPQASVYLLGHAFDGSIRDFSLFTYPLTFIDPAIARDFLKFIYTCIDEQGKITYALHGFGKKLNVPGVHSNPSDQYFFVTWITAEYVFLTRDFGFFNEPITIKNAQGKGKEILVKELLGRLIKFVLSPAIGLGDHGMVHVRDGDWNDGITFLAKNRSAFIKHGESTFNSAMLLLSFAKAIPLVERFDPSLASEMQSAMTTVHEAIDHAWNGKWYARGYDGKGNALGNDTMFLDHHAWMLQNSSLPAEKMDVLLASIETELIDRSRCGAAIMYPPNPRSSIYPPGWDINGGTWHALNSLLAWGLRARVPEKALMFLERMSMHHRAEEYPNIWYGIWSGPDSYNADYAERPGEAFFHSSTPMCDFPFMNNNLHAGFLSAVARFTGVEACFDRIKIDLIHDHPFTFRSKIINIEKTRGFIKIEPGRNFKDDFMIEISIPGPDASRASIKIEPDQEFMIEGNRIVVQWLKESPISSISIQLE